MKKISERNLQAHIKALGDNFIRLNDQLKDAKIVIDNLNTAITIYNNSVEDSQDYIEGVAVRARQFFESSNEIWKTSEDGSKYLQWVEKLESYANEVLQAKLVEVPDLQLTDGQALILDIPLCPEDV